MQQRSNLAILRLLLMSALVLGLSGTLIELVLIEHYEDPWQWAPIGLLAVALVVMAWHAARPNETNLQLLQVLMALIIAAGAVGIWFHYAGAAEFQHEIDPSQEGWAVLTKVLRVKAPPVLAPGLMAQLGLLGLIYVYCHRSVVRAEWDDSPRSDE